jgi:hypothetical protein
LVSVCFSQTIDFTSHGFISIGRPASITDGHVLGMVRCSQAMVESLDPAFHVVRFGKTRTGKEDVLWTQPRKQITLCVRKVPRGGIVLIGCERPQLGKGCSAGYSRDPVRVWQPGTCRSRAMRDGRHTSWASVRTLIGRSHFRYPFVFLYIPVLFGRPPAELSPPGRRRSWSSRAAGAQSRR